jgi:muconolactone delta-isomerase
VTSNDELEMLLAQSPVYNFSHYKVYPLADMTSLPVPTAAAE